MLTNTYKKLHAHYMSSDAEKIISLARTKGIFRSRDLASLNISTAVLSRMVKKGSITRIARGLYSLSDKIHSENTMIAEVAVKYPHGILCLLSALRFHEIGTQSPFEVWFAVPNKSKSPHHEYVPIRTVRFSGLALKEGIDTHCIEGVPVKVTNPARTVADCFKFRNKIGLDVALEALQYAWHNKKVMIDDVWHFAETNRVANVMRPYLESLV